SRAPPSASPLSLSSTRLYFGERSAISVSGARGRGRDTLIVVIGVLVRLADVEASETPHDDILLQLRDVLGDQVLDAPLGFAEVRLLHKHVVLDELLDLSVDDLGDRLLGLSVLLGLALVEVSL